LGPLGGHGGAHVDGACASVAGLLFGIAPCVAALSGGVGKAGVGGIGLEGGPLLGRLCELILVVNPDGKGLAVGLHFVFDTETEQMVGKLPGAGFVGDGSNASHGIESTARRRCAASASAQAPSAQVMTICEGGAMWGTVC